MNKISINGIGWINSTEYGCVLSDHRSVYKDKSILRKEIFSASHAKFGRSDNASKMTCYSAALALKDAGIEYSYDNKKDIGIIGTNNKGSLETDVNYYKDYLATNRTSSRGNLFIYTLPTSPLGEAAIRFGLQGPLLYVASTDNSLVPVMEMAADMILFDEAPALLAGITREDEAVYFLLKKDSDSEHTVLCSALEAISILKKGLAFDEMIREFSALQKHNGK